MKTTIRTLAAVLILAALLDWAATGANRGWTKTSIPVKVVDDVTGIEGVTYRKKFVPGVDFLAVAVGLGIALAGASFLFRTKPTPKISKEQTNNSLK